MIYLINVEISPFKKITYKRTTLHKYKNYLRKYLKLSKIIIEKFKNYYTKKLLKLFTNIKAT